MMKEASEKNVAKFEIREQSDQLPCPDFDRILLSIGLAKIRQENKKVRNHYGS